MRVFQIDAFGAELRLRDIPEPAVEPGQVRVGVRAISVNYRDLLVMRGEYNPRLAFPFTPLSDAAGEVLEIGADVSEFRVGQRVMTNYLPSWSDGPFRFAYLKSALGTPGPGVAAEQIVVPANGLLPMPAGLSFAEAATLPVAGLTAWSALCTVGGLEQSESAEAAHVLTLGTGGVSIFALQIAAALGARVVITSSSDEKLGRAAAMGAAKAINYRANAEWSREVIAFAEDLGVDITVETGGAGTLEQSMRATRAGGRIAFLGSVTGLNTPLPLGLLMMKRLRVEGVVVDSRSVFQQFAQFVERVKLRPVIDRRFAFTDLPAALAHLATGAHFGKIVIEL